MQIREEDFENVNPGEQRILLVEGYWPAEFVSCESKNYGVWGEKLIFHWKVFTSLDKRTFRILYHWHNCQRDKGGRFKFGPLHSYRKDWIAANHGKMPLDPRRLPLSIWKDQTFLVEVVTVRKASNGVLVPSLHWSKIGRVIRPLTEGEPW
jgi:hypothetical protein